MIAAAIAIWAGRRGDDASPAAAPTTTTNPAVELIPPPSGMVVALERLGTGNSSVTRGSSVPLVVSAASQTSLAAIELWADDQLVEQRAVSPAAAAARVAFDWPASGEAVVLSARAVDAGGRTALSDVIRVRVTSPSPVSALVDHVVAEADTIETIAARYHTTPELIALANPGAFQPGTVPVGTTIQVPVRVEPDGTSSSAGPARRPSGPPSPVGLRVDRCTLTVPPPADATGLTGMAAFVLPPDGESFMLAASAPIGASLTVPLAGASSVAVGTFDASVMHVGPPQLVVPDASCATEGWSGDVRLEGTRLVGGADVDSAYLYLSTGAGWERIPADGVVDKGGNGLDFAGLLPDLSSGRMEIEAWGRKDGALTFVGKGSYTAAEHQPVVPTHVRTQLWYVKVPPKQGKGEVDVTTAFVPNPGELFFRWKASSPLVTKIAWQVTAYAVPPTAGIDIPGVLAQDVAPGSQAVFSIDFSKFAGGPQIPTASASSALDLLAQVGGPITVPPGSTPDTAQAGPVVVVGAGGPTVAGGVGELADPQFAIPPPTTFYVRVIPFLGDQFAGRASNLVRIDTTIDIGSIIGAGPITDEPGQNVYQLSLSVTPPKAPKPWYAKCWRITAIDPSQFDPAQAFTNQAWQAFVFHFGNVVCPICYQADNWTFDYAGYYGWHCADDDGFDLSDPSTWDEFPIIGPLVKGLITAGVSVWDFVVELATYLKAKVVDLVSLVGCESFVNAGSAAAGSSPPGQAKNWCHALAEIAVDAALVAAGVPPTLPNFEQLMQAAKGQIVDFVVAQASAAGIPCQEASTAAQVTGQDTLTCEALASALVDKIVATAKAAVSASASAISGIYFPPGVFAVPHEAGQTQPGAVSVTITPTKDAPLTGTTCPATILMAAAYTPPPSGFGLSKLADLNVGYDSNYGMNNGLWMATTLYGGFVIEPTTVQLPKLAKDPFGGQSLQAGSAYYSLYQLASHDDVSARTYGFGGELKLNLSIPFSSLQLHPGATLTTSIHAACATDAAVVGIIQANGQLLVTKVVP